MKSGIVFFLLLSFCPLALAQQTSAISAAAYYQKAVVSKSKQQAFDFFESAINQAKRTEQWDVYLKALSKVMSIVPSLDEKQTSQVFSWMKESVSLGKGHLSPLDLADLHFNCALLYKYKTDERDSALYHYNNARILRIKMLGQWHESVAACYHSMADIYKYYKYEFAEAENNYEKALQIRERTGFSDLNMLAENYYSLAATNRSQQDFQKAISYGSKTIELVKKTNNTQLLERTYTIVANIYRDMGESDTAKAYYNKAIALNLQMKTSPENLAWHYLSLAETFKNDSSYQQAISFFSKAISIYDRIEEVNKELYTYCLYQLAETHLLHHDYKNSLKTYRALLKTLKASGLNSGRQIAEVFTGLGDYYRETHRNDSALFYYQQALTKAIPNFTPISDENPPPESIGMNFYVYRVLNKKASLLKTIAETIKDSRYLLKALQCLILAEELLVKERSMLDMDESKWKFLDANYNVYEEIITIAYEMHRRNYRDSILQLAFHYFEKSKSNSLSEALSEAERSENINRSDSLFRDQNNFKRAVFTVQDELNKALGESVPDANSIAQLRAEMVNLDRKIQLNKLAIENKYPGYFKIKYSTLIPELEDVTRILEKKNQVMIEYFFGNESVYGLCISKKSIMFKRVGSADSLNAIVRSFRNHFNGKMSSLDANVFKTFVTNSHSLYKLLVKPFGGLLNGSKRILIIPDGPMGLVPFETLIEELPGSGTVNYLSLKYLLNRYSVGYAYSSLFLINETQKASSSASALVMAFSGETAVQNINIQTIKGVEHELKMLKNKLPSGQFLVDEQATEFNFRRLSPGHDIIHLAVHGQGDLQKGNASSLYFTAANDSLEDSELHAYELYGLKLSARLVVLSACETGLGKVYKGEGMLSMANAFAYSGCENILMSLWKVNDKVSASLMDSFYEALLKGISIDEAITQAKRQYLSQADELSADPGIWAPLVAYGNHEPVFEKNKNRTMVLIIMASLIVLSLFYFLKYRIKTPSARPS